MSVTVQWLHHAGFRITENIVVYIDPWKIDDQPHDADIILVSHSHYDHYSPADIARINRPDTRLIGSADVISQHGSGSPIQPDQTITLDELEVTGVASYNPEKQFHPRGNQWVGFVLHIHGKRIYYAGDTDLTPEMKNLRDIDLALLPVGGTFTMNGIDAADAVSLFRPQRAVPYHWGDIVGTRVDAERFYRDAECDVTILDPGQALTL